MTVQKPIWYCGLVMLFLASIALQAFAQVPLLQITQPGGDYGLYQEGQTYTITVAADASVQSVFVMTQSPLPDVQPTADPLQFTLTLPTNISPGLYTITAVGMTTSGDVESTPRLLDIERQDAPLSLTAEPLSLSFRAINEQHPLNVWGTYADGVRLFLSNSLQTKYTSSNTTIATVGPTGLANGIVTAKAPGQASITVSAYVYGGNSPAASAPVWVDVTLPPSGPAPVIASVSATTGTPGATLVTVTGTNFGSAQGSGWVQLGSLSATSISSWTPTQIIATVPLGSRSGVVEVRQNGLSSNNIPFTTVVPSITSVNPSTGSTGAAITITGSNFGTNQGSVMFNRAAGVPTTWTDSSIVVPVPADATTGDLIVFANGVASNPVSFTTPPAIAALQPSQGAVGGAVTINGTNFGPTQSTSAVTFNGVAAAVTSWAAGSIAVTVPGGATTGPATVTVNGVASNAPTFTVVNPPSISGLSPASGPVGAAVMISGANFGSPQGASTVTFNGTAATNIASWSPTSITATVPSGATTGNVVVTVSGVASNGVAFTVLPKPQINSLSPTSGPVGTTVTVAGTNFGSMRGTSTVAFSGTTVTSYTSWSATSIKVVVPAGATTGNVVVTVNSVTSNGINFTVTPKITSLSPTSGPVGASVTISGSTFGSTPGTSTVKFNGTTATNVPNWSPSSITAVVPTSATTGNVVVTVGGSASNGVAFTVLPTPHINSLSPTSGHIGATVTISGTNFGSARGSNTVKFNGTAVITYTSWSATTIKVVVPSGATTGNVVVSISGVPSNGLNFTVN